MEESTEGILDLDHPDLAIGSDDPYPDLPVLAPEQLEDGDVLMMLGEGIAKIGGIPIPVSWLIRKLDGGAYSHSAMVSWIDGEPRVWDHSDSWSLHPVSLAQGIRKHAWCHVYRMQKHGEPLGSKRYPREPVVRVLEAHEGDPYDIYLLVLAGVVAVVSRMPKNKYLRLVLRVTLDTIVTLIEWYLANRDIRKDALVCTGVTGLSFWDAQERVPRDYALEVDLERRRAPAPSDPDWEAMQRRIEAVLAQIWDEFPAQLASYRLEIAQGNAQWVEAGSAGLPVNLVSPSDLEFSRTLVRVGKLEIPQAR